MFENSQRQSNPVLVNTRKKEEKKTRKKGTFLRLECE
jgi:hypothetical protein